MKILGISGSPREEGNTSIVVKRALDVCEELGADIDFISLAGLSIGNCMACDACVNLSECVQKDDAEKVFLKMRGSDAIIVGSPTYFSSISAQLKALFDRSIVLRRNNYQLSGKIGGAIVVGGSRNGGQELTIMQIHNWMLLQEMIVIADKRTAHFGGIVVGRNPGDVREDEVGLKTVNNLAHNIIETLEKFKKP